jgi:hypothetical protein
MAEIRLVPFATIALQVGQAALPAYRTKFSRHGFQQPQLLAILGLMRDEDWTFREAEVRLAEHVELRMALGLPHVPDDTPVSACSADLMRRHSSRPCMPSSNGWHYSLVTRRPWRWRRRPRARGDQHLLRDAGQRSRRGLHLAPLAAPESAQDPGWTSPATAQAPVESGPVVRLAAEPPARASAPRLP